MFLYVAKKNKKKIINGRDPQNFRTAKLHVSSIHLKIIVKSTEKSLNLTTRKGTKKKRKKYEKKTKKKTVLVNCEFSAH